MLAAALIVWFGPVTGPFAAACLTALALTVWMNP